jgi:hypothetical protein
MRVLIGNGEAARRKRLRYDVGSRPPRYERSRARHGVLGRRNSIGPPDSRGIGRRELDCFNHCGAIISMT